MDFLRLFWTRDSDYVQGRALRGVILSERYLDENILVINKHLAGPLKGLRLLCYNFIAVIGWLRMSTSSSSRGEALCTKYEHTRVAEEPLSEAGEVS